MKIRTKGGVMEIENKNSIYELIKQRWNKEADNYNQWEELSEEEKIEYAFSLDEGMLGADECVMA